MKKLQLLTMMSNMHMNVGNVSTDKFEQTPERNPLNEMFVTGTLLDCLAQSKVDQCKLLSSTYGAPEWFFEWVGVVANTLNKERLTDFASRVFELASKVERVNDFDMIRSLISISRLGNLKSSNEGINSFKADVIEMHNELIEKLILGAATSPTTTKFIDKCFSEMPSSFGANIVPVNLSLDQVSMINCISSSCYLENGIEASVASSETVARPESFLSTCINDTYAVHNEIEYFDSAINFLREPSKNQGITKGFDNLLEEIISSFDSEKKVFLGSDVILTCNGENLNGLIDFNLDVGEEDEEDEEDEAEEDEQTLSIDIQMEISCRDSEFLKSFMNDIKNIVER